MVRMVGMLCLRKRKGSYILNALKLPRNLIPHGGSPHRTSEKMVEEVNLVERRFGVSVLGTQRGT